MKTRSKKRVTPFVGPMESWWDYLVENNIFTAEQIMEANCTSPLRPTILSTKNIYNWNCHDDVQLIVLVFGGRSIESLKEIFHCSSFCLHHVLHRLFGTDILSVIRLLDKKHRQKILCQAMEAEEKSDMDKINLLVDELKRSV